MPTVFIVYCVEFKVLCPPEFQYKKKEEDIISEQKLLMYAYTCCMTIATYSAYVYVKYVHVF